MVAESRALTEDSMSLTKAAGLKLKCARRTCNMCAGGGVYVDSAGAISLYATDWEPSDGKIEINEFT